MKRLKEYFSNIYHFIIHDLWRITESELSRGKRLPYKFLKVIIIAIRGFVQDDLVVKASALTYSILFALVPLIALFIAVGKGFGFDDMIKDWINQAMVAQKELIPTILEFVDRYLDTAHGGLFIGIGIIILLVSVMNFFKQAENAFNNIWEVKKSRSFGRQFTTYFSALFLIPILIIIAGGISIYFNNLIEKLQLDYILSPILKFGMKFTPFFINWMIFTTMYIVIPNTRVKFSNGLIAGIIAGTAFQLFQNIYIAGQVYLARYDVVYGSFAALPLLLLWLQISCLIVLLGAEISYASQNLQNYEYDGDSKNISIRYKSFLLLFLTWIIVKRFQNHLPAIRNDEITTIYKLPIRLVNQLLTELTDAGIITEIIDEDAKTKSFHPSVDINSLTVKYLNDKIESFGSELFLANKHTELDELWQKHLNIDKINSQHDVLIKDL
jgi:membrane protein